MKLPRFLFLFCLVTCVISYAIRGGFERVWLWYSNRLAVVAASRGVNVRLLVPASPNAQSDFNEFVRVVNNNPDAANVLNPPSLSPAVDATAKRLETMRLTGVYYNNIILPGSGKWHNMMRILQENNRRGIQALDLTKNEDKLLLQQLNNALEGVLHTRQADWDGRLKEWLEKEAKKEGRRPITWKMKKVTRAGTVFELLDIPETLRASSSGSTDRKSLQKWFQIKQAQYVKDGDQNRRNHRSTLQRYRSVWKAQNGGRACPIG
ncbi:hypothetical protein BJY04DRAFT_220062 [Aspergillus karnatakaensis]|uniref:uncharacterized protein n=1 Tax=Aspergillus karnatakaensis TaxID=1810916 RepID=UPI003CCD819B